MIHTSRTFVTLSLDGSRVVEDRLDEGQPVTAAIITLLVLQLKNSTTGH